MQNPILSQLNHQQSASQIPTAQIPDVSGAVNMYRAYQAAQNPAAFLQQIAAQNPMLAQLQQMRGGGANMQQTFYQLCQQKGVDPDSILSQFR